MNEHRMVDRERQQLEQYVERGRQARSDAMRDMAVRFTGFIRGRRTATGAGRSGRERAAMKHGLGGPLCVSCGS